MFTISDGDEKNSVNLDVSSIPVGALTQLHAASDSTVAGYAWLPG